MLKKKYKLIDNLNSLKSTTWLWNSLQGTWFMDRVKNFTFYGTCV